MLRRRSDSTFEFRHVEAALWAARPAPLSDRRREALRLRIFAELGTQDEPRRLLALPVNERWIAIPAGLGIAAVIVAASQLAPGWPGGDGPVPVAARATGDVLVDGVPGTSARQGQRILARSASWVAIGEHVTVGLEQGEAFSFSGEAGAFTLSLETGNATVATTDSGTEVTAGLWSARVEANTVAKFSLVAGATIIEVAEGSVEVTFDGRTFTVTPGNSPLYLARPVAAGMPGLASGPNGDKSPVKDVGPAAPKDAGPAPIAGGDRRAEPGEGQAETPNGSEGGTPSAPGSPSTGSPKGGGIAGGANGPGTGPLPDGPDGGGSPPVGNPERPVHPETPAPGGPPGAPPGEPALPPTAPPPFRPGTPGPDGSVGGGSEPGGAGEPVADGNSSANAGGNGGSNGGGTGSSNAGNGGSNEGGNVTSNTSGDGGSNTGGIEKPKGYAELPGAGGRADAPKNLAVTTPNANGERAGEAPGPTKAEASAGRPGALGPEQPPTSPVRRGADTRNA